MRMYLVQVGTGYAVVETSEKVWPNLAGGLDYDHQRGKIRQAVNAMTRQRTWRVDDPYPRANVRIASEREVEAWQWMLAADRVLKGARSKKAKRETVIQSPLFSTRELAALDEVAA